MYGAVPWGRGYSLLSSPRTGSKYFTPHMFVKGAALMTHYVDIFILCLYCQLRLNTRELSLTTVLETNRSFCTSYHCTDFQSPDSRASAQTSFCLLSFPCLSALPALLKVNTRIRLPALCAGWWGLASLPRACYSRGIWTWNWCSSVRTSPLSHCWRECLKTLLHN